MACARAARSVPGRSRARGSPRSASADQGIELADRRKRATNRSAGQAAASSRAPASVCCAPSACGSSWARASVTAVDTAASDAAGLLRERFAGAHDLRLLGRCSLSPVDRYRSSVEVVLERLDLRRAEAGEVPSSTRGCHAHPGVATARDRRARFAQQHSGGGRHGRAHGATSPFSSSRSRMRVMEPVS